jgi:hypothetical protein
MGGISAAAPIEWSLFGSRRVGLGSERALFLVDCCGWAPRHSRGPGHDKRIIFTFGVNRPKRVVL